jgi:WD40 repeat protein
MPATSLRVFLSHTSEFAAYPTGRTFVRAAIDAVLKAGHHPVDMSHFSAADQRAADYCRRQVLDCDLYVGVLGFRYGSPVRDQADVSYTQLEYLTAGAAGIPRLVFMLQQDDRLPKEFDDPRYADRQRDFRRQVAEDLVVQPFTTVDQLEAAILHALARSAELVLDHQPPVRRPWMAPAPTGPVVERPGLVEPLLAALLAPGTTPIGVTTAIEGAGGFGKTTLAAEVSRMENRLTARFPGGLLWITLGRQVSGAELANRVNTVCDAITGRPSTSTDPEVAGIRLGELLDQRPSTLLVIDDVWTASQLKPFLIGGLGHRRLITTRTSGLVPPGAVSILVDTMSHDESRSMLRAGLPHLADTALDQLGRLTGRWPMLLALANGLIAEYVRQGASVTRAAEWVIERLTVDGPAALDVNDPEDRAQAVAATMTASIEQLDPLERERYLDLGIFPEDVDIPLDVLTLLWGVRGPMSPRAAEQFVARLVQARLAIGVWQDGPGLRLHDVIRGYLRHQRGPAQLVWVNGAFLNAARELLTGTPDPSSSPWWTLPPSAGYLWWHVCYHLAGADRHDELQTLVTHPLWLVRKLERFGAVAVDADLTYSEGNATLRTALARASHLLTPLQPSIVETVVSRLHGIGALEPLVRRFDTLERMPVLAPHWPLPDRPDATLRQTLEGHTAAVRSCAVSPDGTLLVSGSFDCNVRVWSVAGKPKRLVLRGHTSWVWDCAVAPDGRWLASAADDGTVRIWDTDTGTLLRTLELGDGATACVIGPDGSWLATAGLDGIVRVWDSTGGHLLRELDHGDSVTRCAVAPDGTWLASAGADGTVRMWQVADGAERAVLCGHDGRINACAVAPDGTWLVSAGIDGTIRIWDVATGAQRGLLEGHGDWVNGCAVAPDGTWLASAGADGTVRMWDVATLRARAVLPGLAGGANGCVIAPDGSWVAAACADRTVRIWDMVSQNEGRQQDDRIDHMRSCTVSPTGGLVAAGTAKGLVRAWVVDSEELLLDLPGHSGWVRSCAFAADGALLASGGADRSIRVWDVPAGVLRQTLAGHEGWVNRLAFSQRGDVLLSGSSDHTLGLWNPMTGVLTARYDCESPVFGCTIAPDGSWVAAGCADRTVQIWDADAGRRRLTLTGHGGRVNACAAAPDGSWVATASFDRAVRIWDTTTGALIALLDGHTGPLWGAAVDDDGRLLACVSTDGTANIWDVPAREHVAAIRVDGPLRDCAWLPDGRGVCMVGGSGVYLFALDRSAFKVA